MKRTRKFLPLFSVLLGSWLWTHNALAQDNAAESNAAEPMVAEVHDSHSAPLESTNEPAPNHDLVPIIAKSFHGHSQPIVLFWQNAELKADDTAETVVVIGGSAVIRGKVKEAVVSIGGNVEVDGEVGQSAVAVLGNVKLTPKAHVHEDTVAVMGSIEADSGAKVRGNTVAVGGKLNVADGAQIGGDKVNVGLPGPLGNFDWLRNWIKYCLFEFRPLAFQVGFVWVIAAIYLLLYLLVALGFSRPVATCVEHLKTRAATMFLFGLLAKLVVTFLYLILFVTGVGVILIPVIGMAVTVFTILGKVAILEWIGGKLGKHFGDRFQTPLPAFLLGAAVLTLLYVIPLVGGLTALLFGVWGLGVGVVYVFGGLRRETPGNMNPPSTPGAAFTATPTPPPAAPAPFAGGEPATAEVAPPLIDPAPQFAPAPEAGARPNATPPGAGTAPLNEPKPAPKTSAFPVMPGLSSLPKAALWERILAALLDIILIAIVVNLARLQSWSLLIALAYFSGMWAWRGTSIGGVVLKLRVVRSDDRRLTFIVALVRGLAAAFSVVVLLLGYLWIAWDKDKQGWHDKIAGTFVVRQPQATPLVML